jgi:flagellar biosynthesis/type III secretory pathway protein FliH
VVNVVRAAIEEIQDATSIHVRVHPDDHLLLKADWGTLGRNALGEPINLVADDRVQPGGCLIETGLGHIDGQLSTRLSQVHGIFGAILDGEPT